MCIIAYLVKKGNIIKKLVDIHIESRNHRFRTTENVNRL